MFQVVSVHQPCENKLGPQSVWSQHQKCLDERQDERDPRTAFREDFIEELTDWINMGDQMLVGGDLNKSVFSQKVQDIFAPFNMTNTIFSKHEANDAPKSYFRTSNGHVMDGMWCTPGLTAVKCGYLEPRDIPGDHSAFWVDLSHTEASQ